MMYKIILEVYKSQTPSVPPKKTYSFENYQFSVRYSVYLTNIFSTPPQIGLIKKSYMMWQKKYFLQDKTFKTNTEYPRLMLNFSKEKQIHYLKVICKL